MYNCPTCDGKVAKSADSCVHCGEKFGIGQKSYMQGAAIARGKEKSSAGFGIGQIIFLAVIGYLLYSCVSGLGK